MTTAVLLSCHGTVERLDDLPAFVTNIRRGRPAPPEVIDEVRRRFQAIGGSPLMRITQAQADALAARLGLPVAIAGRLWHPYPGRGARRAPPQRREARRLAAARAAVRRRLPRRRPRRGRRLGGMEVRCVPAWGLEPALIDAFVEVIDEALARIPEEGRAKAAVILSAHSLPQRIIAAGDPYERQFRAMAAEVERRIAARGNPVLVAFQSQGMTGDAWLGPDLAVDVRRRSPRAARGRRSSRRSASSRITSRPSTISTWRRTSSPVRRASRGSPGRRP